MVHKAALIVSTLASISAMAFIFKTKESFQYVFDEDITSGAYQGGWITSMGKQFGGIMLIVASGFCSASTAAALQANSLAGFIRVAIAVYAHFTILAISPQQTMTTGFAFALFVCLYLSNKGGDGKGEVQANGTARQLFYLLSLIHFVIAVVLLGNPEKQLPVAYADLPAAARVFVTVFAASHMQASAALCSASTAKQARSVSAGQLISASLFSYALFVNNELPDVDMPVKVAGGVVQVASVVAFYLSWCCACAPKDKKM